MALQKNRRSRSRTHHKRSAWAKMAVPSSMKCPNCGEVKMPHRVCPSCGFYRNREVGAKAVEATQE